MSYIVPKELPDKCDHCPFAVLKYYHPFWAKENANHEGFYCPFDKKIRDYIINDENTKRPDDCVLKEVE